MEMGWGYQEALRLSGIIRHPHHKINGSPTNIDTLICKILRKIKVIEYYMNYWGFGFLQVQEK